MAGMMIKLSKEPIKKEPSISVKSLVEYLTDYYSTNRITQKDLETIFEKALLFRGEN